jgi:hypothetical protein
VSIIDEIKRRNDELMKLYRSLRQRIKQSADALREASMGYMIEYLDEHPDIDTDSLLNEWENTFHIPLADQQRLSDDLRQAMIEAGDARTDMYRSLGVSIPETPVPYENLISTKQVDFPRLQNTMMNGVRNRLQSMIALGTDSRLVETWLRSVGETNGSAATLATTAFAQFDNAYTFQVARQAGIDRFIYMGQTAERQFCRTHLGNTYTRTEIERMSNGQGLSVMTSCGGYNCRHMWVAVPGNQPAKQPHQQTIVQQTDNRDDMTKKYFNAKDIDVLGNIEQGSSVSRSWQQIFGIPLDTKQMAFLCGAPDNAVIDVYTSGNNVIKFDITHPLYYGTSERTLVRNPDGSIYLHNDILQLLNSAPDGLGTRIAAHQVRQAREMGISKIITHAAGRQGEHWAGSYTWPLLGYDCDIPSHIAARLPKKLMDAKRVSDLVRTKYGRKWWKSHRDWIWTDFDLDPMSVSSKQHNAYLKEKGVLI